jgi:hypothetical protein
MTNKTRNILVAGLHGDQEYGVPVKKLKRPSMTTLSKWCNDGVAKATDGCKVEPDGVCVHGKKSWLLVMGLI